MNDIIAAHFQLIRTRIEAEMKLHSIIMVTSAKADDGARLTAFGLAECLAAAGHQTALIDATANPVAALDGRFKTSMQRDFPIYSLPRNTIASSRASDTLESFARQMREEFDYTIVDAPPFGRESMTVKLAAKADAVLIALRAGREPCAGDNLMVQALGLAGAALLGVIAATPESIAHFEEHGGAQYVADARPRAATAVPTSIGGDAVVRMRQAR